MTESTYPRAFAHVGVTVPDAEEAVEWYTDVLGLQHVMGPMTVEHGEDHIGRLCADVLGDTDWETVEIAHLATSDGTGVELFEFDDTEAADPDPKTPGPFHVCVIDPDVEALAERIAESGGEHHTDVWKLFPDQQYRMTYCKDPFGNLVEIYSHGYERIYANQGDY